MSVACLDETGLRLPAQTLHAVCNAHLLRNLEAIIELEPMPDGWAARMQRLLLGVRDWHDRTGSRLATILSV